jgi:hypothetical protein
MPQTMEPTIKITKINNRYHARLIVDGVVHDEMACSLRCDIGWISREMLRWYDKLGGDSKFAKAARKRQTEKPEGKVWFKNDLRR